MINPVILPLAFGFFLTSWFVWKYCILYFYERSHESGGQMFQQVWGGYAGGLRGGSGEMAQALIHAHTHPAQVADGIMTTLYFAAVFSGILLITRRAWVTGGLCIILLPILLSIVQRLHLLSDSLRLPIEALVNAPVGITNPLQYVPPSLRNGAVGWYPEQQKVWEKYGIPRYV